MRTTGFDSGYVPLYALPRQQFNMSLPQMGQDYAAWGTQPTAGMPGATAGTADATAPTSFMDNFLTKTDAKGMKTDGWGGLALGTAQGLFNAWMGMKNYGLAKDTLNEGKRQFAMNYDAQRTTTNSALEDRQRARVASNQGAYQSVGDYMAQNGIRG